MNASNGEALKSIGRMAIAILQDKPLDQLTEVENTITARFRNPATPSIVSQADAMTKIASATNSDSWLPKTPIFWEELGFSEERVNQLMDFSDEQTRKETLSVISNALTAQPTSEGESE